MITDAKKNQDQAWTRGCVATEGLLSGDGSPGRAFVAEALLPRGQGAEVLHRPGHRQGAALGPPPAPPPPPPAPPSKW